MCHIMRRETWPLAHTSAPSLLILFLFSLVSNPGLRYASYKEQQFWAGQLTTVRFFE